MKELRLTTIIYKAELNFTSQPQAWLLPDLLIQEIT